MRLGSTACPLALAACVLSSCGNTTDNIGVDVKKMTNQIVSEEEKMSNREVILNNLASYSAGEIKDCVSAMDWAEWTAKTYPASGLNLEETTNQRLFWMEALRINLGEVFTLPEILESSTFNIGHAEMSRDEGHQFQDDIAKGCAVKMANALSDIGVSTGYEK